MLQSVNLIVNPYLCYSMLVHSLYLASIEWLWWQRYASSGLEKNIKELYKMGGFKWNLNEEI